MNYISFDFDFFIRENAIWDFGHSENSPIFANLAWISRYAGLDLYKETAIETYADFSPADTALKLQSFGFKFENAFDLGVADSHKFAYDFLQEDSGSTIYHFDAHSDLYKENSEIDCANWMYRLYKEKKVKNIIWVYPDWLDFPPDTEWFMKNKSIKVVKYSDFKLKKEVEISKVFVCRSGVWVPPHHDSEFLKMIRSFIILTSNVHQLEGITKRSFPTEQEAKQQYKQMEEMMVKMRSKVKNGI